MEGDFFAARFAARPDIYAVRWENTRTSKVGWLPVVHGGLRANVRHGDRTFRYDCSISSSGSS